MSETDDADAWDLVEGDDLAADQTAWMRKARRIGQRLGVLAAFAIALGLILVGIGNGVWRLTALDQLADPGGFVTFVFHLATASTLVVLGASLLPVALRLLGGEGDVSLHQPAALFATLWIVIGVFHLFTGGFDPGETVGGALVLVMAGVFGLLALSLYDPRRSGPSLSAGVLGLVAGGLLIGGVSTVPGSITNASRLGGELVFRYGEALHVSGYLVAILAATVYPFVRSSSRGRAGVLVGGSLGGVLWGLGEVVFAAWWLAGSPWTLFGGLDAGASAGFGFVLAGGLATVVGGLAALGMFAAWAGFAATPLASSLTDSSPEASASSKASRRTCPSCRSTVTTADDACPGCGHELAAG